MFTSLCDGFGGALQSKYDCTPSAQYSDGFVAAYAGMNVLEAKQAQEGDA